MLDKRKFYINGEWVLPSKPNDFDILSNQSIFDVFKTYIYLEMVQHILVTLSLPASSFGTVSSLVKYFIHFGEVVFARQVFYYLFIMFYYIPY